MRPYGPNPRRAQPLPSAPRRDKTRGRLQSGAHHTRTPPLPDSDAALFDLAIIGGGINGAAIARDAAGRGWRVLLCEQGDLGRGTSSASTKLIHGGLRYLEHYEFRLVREALLEREVMWAIAPHIIWPLRFVLPHHAGLRPAWLLRLGLFLYDHIGGRRRLPPTRTLRLDRDPAGAPLKPAFTRGFEYSDCWVEDSRLVVLHAADAAARGAQIATRTRCTAAERADGAWRLTLDGPAGVRAVRARAVVNAAGPWVGEVLGGVLRANAKAHARLVQGSHIVVRRLFDHERCYIFQNADGRIFFAIPYETDFTLIGTTDQDFHGDPAAVRISEAEIAYLCAGASEYFRRPVTPGDVVWTYSGVRALYDDGATAAQEATRDYVLALDAPPREAALLSVFGGKITTARRLAEAALAKLAPHLPAAAGEAAGWTGRASLPGGNFPIDGFAALVAEVQRDYPFLPAALARRLVRAYGTHARRLLGAARSMEELGRDFGAGLTEAELAYLVAHEFAASAEDVVWRRSKLGLRLAPGQIAAIEAAMQRLVASRESPSR
ncbi:MAG: glycerol-3-phosphate dehydrogenase [Rhodospirillales bacterium]|nr:glycerol-3-phosphate dehydrogenase [Rhodospirillales bacterium]